MSLTLMISKLNTGKQHPCIVHLIGTLNIGGAEQTVVRLATNSSLSMFQHIVICLYDKTGPLISVLDRAKIRIYSCPLWLNQKWFPSGRVRNMLSIRTFPLRLAALLKLVRADLVHTQQTLD